MKLFIQEAAEQDILQQVEWYAEQGLADIAKRFSLASVEAIQSLMRMPEAGPPRLITNPDLAGLRSWAIKGFDELRIYYFMRAEMLFVIRVLHSKRNTVAILEDEEGHATK